MKLFIERIHKLKNYSTSSYLELINKYKIRDDIFEIYKACAETMLKSPDMDSRTRPPVYYWYSQAIYNGERAKNFDPHKSIVGLSENFVQSIDIFDTIFSSISILMTIITALFGLITIISWIQNWSSSIYFLFFCLFLLILKVFFYIYKKILILDTEMIQKVNSNLIFEHDDLIKIRGKKSSIIAANIWNSSLSKSNTHIFLFEITLLKSLFQSFYWKIYRRLIDDVASYVPDYIKSQKNKGAFFYYIWRRTHPKKLK